MQTKYLLLTVEIISHASLCERLLLSIVTKFYCCFNEMLHLVTSPVGQLWSWYFSPQQSRKNCIPICGPATAIVRDYNSLQPPRYHRSQSAVEATADYLGTRVVRLSYLNLDEANRNIFIYRGPKRWTIKVINTWESTTLRVHAVLSFVFRGTYGLKGHFKVRQLLEMYRMTRSARKTGIWSVKFWQCVW